MSRQREFSPADLDALEGRLAPAAMVPPVAAPPAADVVQQGDFQGQFGDQTTPDTAPGVPDPSEAFVAPGVPDAYDAYDAYDAPAVPGVPGVPDAPNNSLTPEFD